MNKRNKGIWLSYGYTVLNMIFGLFLSSYLLRMLGDTEYGVYQTVSSFVTYLIMLEFGVGTVLTRNILVYRNKGEPEKIKNIVSTLWIVSLVLSIAIAVVAIVFCLNIGNVYSNTMNAGQIRYAKKIFCIITIQLITSFYSQSISGILLGMENYTFSQMLNIIKVILRTVVLIILIWFKPYAIIIALVDVILSIMLLIITYVYVKGKYKIEFSFKYFDFAIVKESLPLCIAILIQAFVNQANNNVDKTIIGIMISVESVAIYSVAQYIYSVFSSLTSIPISMYMPKVAKDLQDGLKGRELTNALVEPCRLVVGVGGLVVFGFFAIGRQFVSIVYGSEKTEAWLYALIIMIPMFVNMTNGVIVNVLDVLNKRIVRSWILLCTTVLNIILTIIFIHLFEIIGAVIATAISTILGQIILMNLYYSKKLGIEVWHLFKESYRGLLSYMVIFSIISFGVATIIPNDYLALAVGGTLFLGLSSVCILLFGLNSSERQKFNMIIRRKKA